jgi:predicted helicase
MLSGERLLKVKDFKSLVKFLVEELDWPIDIQSFEDIEDWVFEYSPEELGIPDEYSVKTQSIKQLRPIVANQPWAIFYIDFKPKRLPVTVLRRILNAFVEKKRSHHGERPTWKVHDLLFINTHGKNENRGTTFAHFSSPENGYTHIMREFMWNQKETHFAHICRYVECLKWPDEGVSQKEWREQWRSAFIGSKRKSISDSGQLAVEMAYFAIDVRQRVSEILELTRDNKNDPVQHLYETFKKVLIHNLEEDDFADMYAQTMTYGLFTARSAKPSQHFNIQNAAECIPDTNPFLRDLFRQCFGLTRKTGGRLDIEELGLSRLVELFESLTEEDMRRIQDEFGSATGDPVIHFYEGFLQAYDPTSREMRGVYYTPDPIVSYIIRSVHETLKKDFDLKLGLADASTWAEVAEKNGFSIPQNIDPEAPFVRILDPATGTGTFLKHAIKLIYETMYNKWVKEESRDADYLDRKWNEYVDKNLLPRIFGFELMPASYAVCHMKLGLYLRDLGYHFQGHKRLNVFLTNSLEKPSDFFDADIAEFMAHEASDANRVKEGMPATVVIGNPPYSGHSANNNPWIAGLLRGQDKKSPGNYFELDGKPLGERNSKWLNDDYVKFIRLGHLKIERTGYGILAFISNHGYLDNPTFRGMRQSLMNSFDDIYVYDLHGNAKKKETAPDGSKDENVFDIQQGVAICLMVKKSFTGVKS